MNPQGEDLLKLFARDGTAGGRLAETVGRDGTALLKVLLKAGASEVSSELF